MYGPPTTSVLKKTGKMAAGKCIQPYGIQKWTEEIRVNRCYRIRNKLSNLYLTAGHTNITSPDTVSQFQELGSEDEKRHGQVWHLLPMQDKYYQLRNVLSGCYLSVIDVNKPGAQLRHMEHTSLAATADTSTRTWDIYPDKVSNENCYLMENVAGKLLVGVQNNSSTVVEQNEFKSGGSDKASQVWIFEMQPFEPQCVFLFDDEDVVEGDEKDIGEVVGGGDKKNIGKVLEGNKKDIGQPPHDAKRKSYPPSTEEVLIGEVKMQFPVVGLKTSDLPVPVLLEGRTHILRRYGYWKAIYFMEHPGFSTMTATLYPETGLISENGKKIKEMTGITVTSDTTLYLSGAVEKRYGKKLGLALNVLIGREGMGPKFRKVKVALNYDDGLGVAETVWFRQDRYVLEEVDGELLMEWKIMDPSNSKIDRQPFLEHSSE